MVVIGKATAMESAHIISGEAENEQRAVQLSVMDYYGNNVACMTKMHFW